MSSPRWIKINSDDDLPEPPEYWCFWRVAMWTVGGDYLCVWTHQHPSDWPIGESDAGYLFAYWSEPHVVDLPHVPEYEGDN